MRKRFAVLMLAVMMMVLAGCGGKGDSPVVGDWKLDTAKVMGVTMDVEEYADLIGEDMDFSISIKDDGTFSMELTGDTADGTWEYKEPTVTFTSDETITAEYKDEKLTMELAEEIVDVEGGMTLVFTK